MLNPTIFWSAFARAGMLFDATYQPAAGPAKPVKVGFVQPDQLLGDLVQSTEYQVEYQTADMPDLGIGEGLTMASGAYKVRSNPEKKGDGFFSIVKLTKL
jgi:hypothetical protein